MSVAMPQATMNGQPLNWGQAPAQSNGKRWGKLAVKLAIGVGVVVAIGAGVNWAFPAIAETLFGTAATLGGSIAASMTGVTDALSGVVEHITGLTPETTSTVVDHTKEGLTNLANNFAPSADGFIFAENWEALNTQVKASLSPQLEALQNLLTQASNNVGTMSTDAGAAFKASVEGQSQAILDNIQQAANQGILSKDAAIGLVESFTNNVESSFNDIGGGLGLLDLKAEHYAMAAGGLGAGVIGTKLFGGSNTPQAANQNRVPPAPHPSAIRPNVGRMSAKFHNQDLANHLAANGIPVEGATQQPTQRTI